MHIAPRRTARIARMPEVLATRHRRRRNASASSRQRAGGALIDPGPLSVGKWWVSRADSMFGPVVCEDVAGQHDPILQRSRASRGCAPVRPLHRGVVIGLPPCSAAGSLASQWRVRIASCCPSRARTTGCAGLPGRASRMPIRSRWRSCAPYMLSVPGNVSRRASAYLGS